MYKVTNIDKLTVAKIGLGSHLNIRLSVRRP